MQSRLQELDEKITKLENEKDFIIERLHTLPGEDLTGRVEKLMEDRELAQQARSIMEELKRQYPDLDEIKREIEELSRTMRSGTLTMWLWPVQRLNGIRLTMS